MGDKSFISTIITNGLLAGAIIFVGIIIHYFAIGEPNNIGWVIIPFALIVSFFTSFRSENDKFFVGFVSGVFSVLLIMLFSFILMWLSGNERAFYNLNCEENNCGSIYV